MNFRTIICSLIGFGILVERSSSCMRSYRPIRVQQDPTFPAEPIMNPVYLNRDVLGLIFKFSSEIEKIELLKIFLKKIEEHYCSILNDYGVLPSFALKYYNSRLLTIPESSPIHERIKSMFVTYVNLVQNGKEKYNLIVRIMESGFIMLKQIIIESEKDGGFKESLEPWMWYCRKKYLAIESNFQRPVGSEIIHLQSLRAIRISMLFDAEIYLRATNSLNNYMLEANRTRRLTICAIKMNNLRLSMHLDPKLKDLFTAFCEFANIDPNQIMGVFRNGFEYPISNNQLIFYSVNQWYSTRDPIDHYMEPFSGRLFYDSDDARQIEFGITPPNILNLDAQEILFFIVKMSVDYEKRRMTARTIILLRAMKCFEGREETWVGLINDLSSYAIDRNIIDLYIYLRFLFPSFNFDQWIPQITGKNEGELMDFINCFIFSYKEKDRSEPLRLLRALGELDGPEALRAVETLKNALRALFTIMMSPESRRIEKYIVSETLNQSLNNSICRLMFNSKPEIFIDLFLSASRPSRDKKWLIIRILQNAHPNKFSQVPPDSLSRVGKRYSGSEATHLIHYFREDPEFIFDRLVKILEDHTSVHFMLREKSMKNYALFVMVSSIFYSTRETRDKLKRYLMLLNRIKLMEIIDEDLESNSCLRAMMNSMKDETILIDVMGVINEVHIMQLDSREYLNQRLPLIRSFADDLWYRILFS